jgi:uncharacterized membrane protein YhhN
MYTSSKSGFCHCCFYFILDLLYICFAILYNIGDVDHADNFLKYVKAVPVWIMMIQLFTFRKAHKHVVTVMVGLFCGSIGDMCLIWQQEFALFAAGIFAFLVGHIVYTTAFVFIARDAAQGKTSLEEGLSFYPLFIIIWLVLMTFSFFSISTISNYLAPDDYVKYILDIYGTVLTLLTMAGFFVFFVCHKVSSEMYWAGLLWMFASLIFYASDNFLAHGKYNTWYIDRVSASTNSYLIMITYYVAQFLIGKGAYFAASHFSKTEEVESKDTKGPSNTEFRMNTY